MTKFVRPEFKNGMDVVNGRAFSKKRSYNVRFPNNVLVLDLKPIICKNVVRDDRWGGVYSQTTQAFFEIEDDTGRNIRFRSTDVEIEVN